MNKQFKDIKIGQSFQVISGKLIMVYEKVGGLRARCINQFGYNNTRAIGGLYSFAPNSRVSL